MKLDLTSRPATVATVTQLDDLVWLGTNKVHPCDLLEFRIDNLFDHLDQTEECLHASSIPGLLTVRRSGEGGANNLDAETRLALYQRFVSSALLVDTEIASLEEAEFA
ncbi:MAG: type I 3-dehydroquinate dehydratase, partial [Verrucomicrobiota bacterium]